MPQGHQRAMAHRRRAILRHGRPLFSQKGPKASTFSWWLVGLLLSLSLSLSTPCIAAQELLDSLLGIIRANWHDPEKNSIQRLYFHPPPPTRPEPRNPSLTMHRIPGNYGILKCAVHEIPGNYSILKCAVHKKPGN